ncbi:MAG: peptidyl-prolyl cis-trans isomerase [Armatimonadota bacterium]
MSRAIIAGALTLLICAVSVAQDIEEATEPSPADDTTEALATVDGEQIDADELWWYMQNTRGGRVLDEMIVRQLIIQEAAEQGVKVGTPEVDEAVAQIKQEHGVETGFTHWLQESGQTEKGLRLELQQQLLLDKLIRRHMGLTDEGIQRYYDSNPDEFTEAPRVHLMDIVTLTVEDAFVARERLAAGHDFEDVAREMSHDPTADDGGDRDWITPDDVLCDNVSEVVFAMEQGEISDPVDCGDHAHVFFAKEVDPGRQIPLEEARDAVIERIREVRGVSEELYVALLKQRANIDVRWEAAAYLDDLYADLRTIKIVVDGERIKLPAAPRLLPNSNLIVPFVALLEGMGAEVEWNADAGVLEAQRDERRLRVVAGAEMLAVGNREVPMKEAPSLVDDVLMGSPRGPVEALGGSLVWNRTENTLYVDSRADEAENS